MILCLKTNSPSAELHLYNDRLQQIDSFAWEAHKKLAETLHINIETRLKAVNKQLQDISGIAVYNGDGSFTGLRIGISVVNALGYSLEIPVISSQGKEWIQQGIESLKKYTEFKPITPTYSSPVFTTEQKK